MIEHFRPPQQRLLEQWVPLLREELIEQLDAVASLPFDLSRVPLSVSRDIGSDAGGGKGTEGDGDADFAASIASSEHLLSEGMQVLTARLPAS